MNQMNHLVFVASQKDRHANSCLRILRDHFHAKPYQGVQNLPPFFVAVFTLNPHVGSRLCCTPYSIDKSRMPGWCHKTIFYFGLEGDPYLYQDTVLETAIHLDNWLRMERNDLPWAEDQSVSDVTIQLWKNEADRLRKKFKPVVLH